MKAPAQEKRLVLLTFKLIHKTGIVPLLLCTGQESKNATLGSGKRA